MAKLSLIFAAVAAGIHIYFFILESLQWGKPKTMKTFNVTAEESAHLRSFAFSQGFYNLFLAIAILAGLALHLNVLLTYGLLSMIAASLVLLYNNPKLRKGALIQGLPPILAFLCHFLA